MKNVTILCLFALTVMGGCSALTKKPFMCCATKTSVRCTQEVPVGEVAVGAPGEICAVSTDILKAQAAAQGNVQQ